MFWDTPNRNVGLPSRQIHRVVADGDIQLNVGVLNRKLRHGLGNVCKRDSRQGELDTPAEFRVLAGHLSLGLGEHLLDLARGG